MENLTSLLQHKTDPNYMHTLQNTFKQVTWNPTIVNHILQRQRHFSAVLFQSSLLITAVTADEV